MGRKEKTSPEETRQRLVLAGLELFGEKGFSGTRTRELARTAGVNQAAIPYHFDGKEGLYRAVAEYVVRRGHEDMMPALERVKTTMSEAGGDSAVAIQLVVGFMHAFIDRIATSEDISARSSFIMREYSRPGIGFDIIYNGLIREFHTVFSSMVAVVMGRPPESEAVIVKAHSLFSIVVGLVMTRTILFKRADWEGFTPDRLELIKKTIGEVVTHGLQPEISGEGRKHD